ncbi:XRE family transcriptional regulator [Chryseobacterium phosphatilyticum]|uniref:XRE family transcriptional regulator n=1 Tax=Chryseobacterium phosphatilyticum TaxID=475075 RepID=A0A316XEJ4_9FLAO|nr:helix-turn-helix domain-containing protein [Chryseobacterium phosphatilyticum]PWN71106.1 XRE family transcriptional regulator [Chryseobacterium phosphatilyticum]
MSKLLKYRESLNLTQEELAAKSGISIRTIQRIEAGTEPKGYTLRALAKALHIKETELLKSPVNEVVHYQLIKLINLSSLPFIIFPPMNIFAPLLIMYFKKENNLMVKQIASLQILWTLVSAILFFLSPFLNRIFSIDFPFILIVAATACIINICIIILNAISIDRQGRMCIFLNFSFL